MGSRKSRTGPGFASAFTEFPLDRQSSGDYQVGGGLLMLFNTVSFFIFFAVVYLLYWHVPDAARRWLLLAASLVFYGWWDQLFLLHFVLVILLNYAAYTALRQSGSRVVLTLVLVLNLGNLLFFKYVGAVLRVLVQDLGIAAAAGLYDELGSLVLPLAISFYSFQILALAVDVWRGEVSDRLGLRDYALFVVFFPQLIAGPIMRHSDFFYQLKTIVFSERRMFAGIYLVIFGLIKKGFIADNLGGIIDPVYANPLAYSARANFAAAVGFAVQIYLDFSGYTDMARGVAKLLGYQIPENFRGHYFAQSFSEHWKRWHITLSTWLRDYLYIPLGGSRGGEIRTNLNLFLTMSLGGLWHGHNFTYLIWGMMEGTYLVIERALGLSNKTYRNWGWRILAVLVVFLCCTAARVVFRADTLPDAWAVFAGISGYGGSAVPENFSAFSRFMLFALIAHGLEYNKAALAPVLDRYRYYLVPVAGLVALLAFARLQIPGVNFIYFQF